MRETNSSFVNQPIPFFSSFPSQREPLPFPRPRPSALHRYCEAPFLPAVLASPKNAQAQKKFFMAFRFPKMCRISFPPDESAQKRKVNILFLKTGFDRFSSIRPFVAESTAGPQPRRCNDSLPHTLKRGIGSPPSAECFLPSAARRPGQAFPTPGDFRPASF